MKGVNQWSRRCTQCGEDKEISEFAFNNKKKGTYHPECKKCMSKRWAKNHVKEKLYNEEGLEVITRYGATTYLKNGIPVKKKCTVCGEEKEISDFYLRDKERKAYKSYCKECDKKMQIEWLKNNPNYHKEQYLNNIERHKENGKRYRENNPKCSQRWKEKILKEEKKMIKGTEKIIVKK